MRKQQRLSETDDFHIGQPPITRKHSPTPPHGILCRTEYLANTGKYLERLLAAPNKDKRCSNQRVCNQREYP